MKRLNKKISELVPLFYSLSTLCLALNFGTGEFQRMFALETKIRMLEFKKMGVVELEIIDKNKKKKIEYHYLNEIEDYLVKFVKRNKKYKFEKEESFGIKTGRYILTRVYRTYNKKYKEENVCPECGRSYDD